MELHIISLIAILALIGFVFLVIFLAGTAIGLLIYTIIWTIKTIIDIIEG